MIDPARPTNDAELFSRSAARLATLFYGELETGGILIYCNAGHNPPFVLGKTGIRVMTRIMGLILAAIAVQFVLSGIQEAFGI